MKHITQTEFIISLEDLLFWMNEKLKSSGFKEISPDSVEKLYLGMSDETQKVDDLHVVLKKKIVYLF